MLRIISALILAVTATVTLAQEKLQLVDNPPERRIVVQGDTLWGIAGEFMKEPWRWPEIWRLNKDQVKNPHLIYPGDIIVLDNSSGSPRLKVAQADKLQPQVYSTDVRKAIPSIPTHIIAPFIARPLIIEPEALKKAPMIVASQEDRVYLGNGDTAFASGITNTSIIDWSVYRPAKPLKDPDTQAIIGYEAADLGAARLLKATDPATLKIVLAREEIGRGDRLAPIEKNTLMSYVPQAPTTQIAAKVLSIYGDGLNEAGRHSVISINRGRTNGVEVGNVLALHRTRSSYGYDEQNRRVNTPLPNERYGMLFIFRTFQNISYGLVMDAAKPVVIGDSALNP